MQLFYELYFNQNTRHQNNILKFLTELPLQSIHFFLTLAIPKKFNPAQRLEKSKIL